VGINRIEDALPKGLPGSWRRRFEDCLPKVKMISPVPGGVGPMTIAVLMKNTDAALKEHILNH
jgi:5,10-methylene-tetrahydrofolate dehydrogenase/methenyl tetrahydrofolate cyclohydrolase